MSKLLIELVPRSCFYSNVRSEVTKQKWDIIRKDCYQEYNYKCGICDGKGDKHPVECHEIWEYNYPAQKLIGFIALCPKCHQVKHFGLAQIRGKSKEATKHLMKVNGWDRKQAERHIKSAFILWTERSECDWKLDISVLEEKEELEKCPDCGKTIDEGACFYCKMD